MLSYRKGFVPYALAAFLIGFVGGFSTVLGPAFVADLQLDYNNTTWTALAQAISTAACAPILGKLGDRLGRRRTLTVGLLVYTLGNLLTVAAASLPAMLLARFTVGLGTAAMAPLILGYIVTEFPPERVAKGFSAYMLISGASVIAGPTLGALALARYGWRGMSAACVAICAAVSVLCIVFREKENAPRKNTGKFDLTGGILMIFVSALALCVPSFGQNFGWTSSVSLAVIAAALLALLAFLFSQLRTSAPILPAAFLARRGFLLSVAALFLTQGLLQANMTAVMVFVAYIRPSDTIVSGYAISVLYLGMSLGALALGPLADQHEPRNILTISFLCTALGCALMLRFDEKTSALLLMASLGVLGFGLGANGTIFLKVALAGLPRSEAGVGAGSYALFRDLSAPFGVAVLVPLFTNRITALLSQGFGASSAAVRSIRLLAVAELASVAVGLIIIRFLPKIHQGEERHEIAE